MRRSERVSFTGGQGYELAGIIDRPASKPQAVAVFTHCFTCNKDLKAIVKISRGLADHGFAVLRYDLTGLGNSHGSFSDTNFSSNQRDLLAAVRFAKEQIAAPQFLLGHSFGAACSLSLTPEIESLRGTVSIAGPSDTVHLADLLVHMNPEIREAGSGVVNIGGVRYTINQQMIEDFRAHSLQSSLSQIRSPVLLLHSTHDETLSFEHAQRLFESLSANKHAVPSLLAIPGADHLLTRNPADIQYVVRMIAGWMDRILA